MTDFLPRLVGGHPNRSKATAAFALARQNPGQPVVYLERPRQDNSTQASLAAKIRNLVKPHADLSGYTRVGTDGVVRGYIVAETSSTPDVTPTVTVAPTTSNPAVFDLQFFSDPVAVAKSILDEKTSTPKGRRVKRGRPKAGEISASERFYKRLEARRGEWVTLTYIRHSASGNSLEEDKRRMSNRANTLGNWARTRGLQSPSTRVRVTASGDNVTLSARLA